MSAPIDWPGLGRALHAAGLIADPELPERPLPAAGWLVQGASAFGAWIAASMVISAIGGLVFAALDAPLPRAILGTVTVAAMALWARRRIDPATGLPRESPFIGQFMLALTIAGAGLVTGEIVRAVHGQAMEMLLVGLVAVGVGVINPEPLHRRLSILLAVGCFAGAGLAWRLEPFVTLACAAGAAALWLTQSRWTTARWGHLLGPAAWSLALAAGLLQLPEALAAELRHSLFAIGDSAWVRPLRVVGLASILAASVIVTHRRLAGPPAAGTVVLTIVGCALIAAGAWRMPGILACLLAWVLGTASGRGGLRGLALAGLGGYLWMAYWSTATTLMDKGLAMIATAAVLAGLAAAVRWRRTGGTWREVEA